MSTFLTAISSSAIGAAIALLGVFVNGWISQRNIKNERVAGRAEEAMQEIRAALVQLRHIDREGCETDGGPKELQELLHKIDGFSIVFASEGLRNRLSSATAIMWDWHILPLDEGDPIWISANHALDCIGAYIREEDIPPAPQNFIQLDSTLRDFHREMEAAYKRDHE